MNHTDPNKTTTRIFQNSLLVESCNMIPNPEHAVFGRLPQTLQLWKALTWHRNNLGDSWMRTQGMRIKPIKLSWPLEKPPITYITTDKY